MQMFLKTLNINTYCMHRHYFTTSFARTHREPVIANYNIKYKLWPAIYGIFICKFAILLIKFILSNYVIECNNHCYIDNSTGHDLRTAFVTLLLAKIYYFHIVTTISCLGYCVDIFLIILSVRFTYNDLLDDTVYK